MAAAGRSAVLDAARKATVRLRHTRPMTGDANPSFDTVLIAGVTRVEERHYVEASRAHPRTKASLRGMLILSVVLLFAEGGLVFQGGPAWLHVLAVAGLACAAWLVWKTRSAGRDRYRAMEEWMRQNRYELCPRGLRARSEKMGSEWDWELFESWQETGELFLLALPASVMLVPAYIVVPKAAFLGDEVDPVRAILRERIRPAARAPAAQRRLRVLIVLWLVLVAIFVAFFQLTDP